MYTLCYLLYFIIESLSHHLQKISKRHVACQLRDLNFIEINLINKLRILSQY